MSERASKKPRTALFHILDFRPELLGRFLYWLDPKSLCNVEQTCRGLQSLTGPAWELLDSSICTNLQKSNANSAKERVARFLIVKAYADRMTALAALHFDFSNPNGSSTVNCDHCTDFPDLNTTPFSSVGDFEFFLQIKDASQQQIIWEGYAPTFAQWRTGNQRLEMDLLRVSESGILLSKWPSLRKLEELDLQSMIDHHRTESSDEILGNIVVTMVAQSIHRSDDTSLVVASGGNSQSGIFEVPIEPNRFYLGLTLDSRRVISHQARRDAVVAGSIQEIHPRFRVQCTGSEDNRSFDICSFQVSSY